MTNPIISDYMQLYSILNNFSHEGDVLLHTVFFITCVIKMSRDRVEVMKYAYTL